MSDIASARADRRFASRRIGFLAAALAIAALPMVLTGNYWQTNLTVCAINVLLALGLDFILGYAGQLNLGHSAFYGIGAYASTLLITKLGVPFWVAFVLAITLSGIAGMALSIFAVRLRGHYLAIASLGFAVIVHQILLNWISLTQVPRAIYASFVGTLVPDAFIITESFTILAMVIVGGMGTLIGPVWGAVLLTLLPEILREFGDLRLVLYGAALTLVVLFMPGGMVQAVQILRARVRRSPAAASGGIRP